MADQAKGLGIFRGQHQQVGMAGHHGSKLGLGRFDPLLGFCQEGFGPLSLVEGLCDRSQMGLSPRYIKDQRRGNARQGVVLTNVVVGAEDQIGLHPQNRLQRRLVGQPHIDGLGDDPAAQIGNLLAGVVIVALVQRP